MIQCVVYPELVAKDVTYCFKECNSIERVLTIKGNEKLRHIVHWHHGPIIELRWWYLRFGWFRWLSHECANWRTSEIKREISEKYNRLFRRWHSRNRANNLQMQAQYNHWDDINDYIFETVINIWWTGYVKLGRSIN